jgi:hypothetical protein
VHICLSFCGAVCNVLKCRLAEAFHSIKQDHEDCVKQQQWLQQSIFMTMQVKQGREEEVQLMQEELETMKECLAVVQNERASLGAASGIATMQAGLNNVPSSLAAGMAQILFFSP